MPVVNARYRHNHKEFGAHMMGPDTLKLARAAGEAAKAAALAIAPRSGDPDDSYDMHFDVEATVVTIDGNPRHSSRLVNDSDHAAAVEFGSGVKNDGLTGPNDRPQGGYNEPMRVLAKAGATVGEPQERPR